MQHSTLILGPPGTGKTTTLLNMVRKDIESGIHPDAIGYVSFTRRAVGEAVSRAMSGLKLSTDDAVYFRTLHSLAFRLGGHTPKEILQRKHYREIGDKLGVYIDMSGISADAGVYELPRGDQIVFLEGLARSSMKPLRAIWETVDNDIEYPELDQFARALKSYKEQNGMVDFTDLIERWVKEGRAPKLSRLYVDEAQDLTALQWRMVDKLCDAADRVIITGDDDQAIYRWAGADVESFISRPFTETTVLSQSYRIPKSVHTLAGDISMRIQGRKEKAYQPRTVAGSVGYVMSVDEIDFSKGSWLILARNHYLLKPVVSHIRQIGFPYRTQKEDVTKEPYVQAAFAWERLRKGQRVGFEALANVASYAGIRKKLTPERTDDGRLYSLSDALSLGIVDRGPWYDTLLRMPEEDINYLRAVRRSGESLQTEPRITISTIHGAKGAEADNVAVILDMSQRAYRNYQGDGIDDELRTYYVAVTRAKENLFLVGPTTRYGFEI